MTVPRFLVFVLVCLGMVAGRWPLWAQQELLLADFETPEALREWDFRSGTPSLVTEGVTHGQRALQIVFDPAGEYYGAYLYWSRVPRDWSPYDALVLDVHNPNPEPVAAYVLVADQAWADSGRSYWNRHNAHTSFPPGSHQWVIPVRGLFRGEAGSRNNDIKRNIDPDAIVRMDLGFGRKGSSGRIIIDSVRLLRAGRPAGVWAFDFGPSSQALMPGWIAASHESVYSAQHGYGWGPTGGAPGAGAARDTTFGPMLLQDFCEAGGYNFRIDVPPGRYRVTVYYENCGYWGGEQAMHRQRRILANGAEVWSETRPDGPAHSLWRFEDLEPVGVDIWEAYMAAEVARPAVFEVAVGNDNLTLRFEADRTWGSKVAALALCAADDDEAQSWLRGQFDAVAAEFRRKAVCLDPPQPEYQPPAAWSGAGLVAWPVGIEEEVAPHTIPNPEPPNPDDLVLSALAVRGEYEPLSLAVRPVEDLGQCGLELEPLTGPGTLPATIKVVWYNTSRGFGDISYHIRGHTLREQTAVALPANLTRRIVADVRVPEEAAAGEYRGALLIRDAGGRVRLRVPLQLTVSPVTLSRETEFLMGFFGLMPPGALGAEQRWPLLEQTLALLREYGMNAVSGGPSFRLTGWQNGQPVIDFGEMDRFFALLREQGFDRPFNGYGGPRFIGLHDGYQKGAAAARVEQESGLPYEEAFRRAWAAVDRHAREQGWPTIHYAMCDETRVRDVAERELEFMQLMGTVSAAFPQTVRTSGSYSVHFDQRPDDQNSLLYWHQRFFEALDINSLNIHDESVLAEAQRLGKEVHIYNQGTSRYSFGLYQWSEFRKGVRARWQWHLNILHGYQFFDLDGREPDTAMLCYGRERIYPTLDFVRCREGAEDFYLYQTLYDQIQQRAGAGADDQALRDARRLLEEMTARVGVNQRRPPEGFDADAFKRDVVAAIEANG